MYSDLSVGIFFEWVSCFFRGLLQYFSGVLLVPTSRIFRVSRARRFDGRDREGFSTFRGFPYLLRPSSQGRVFKYFSHRRLPLVVGNYPTRTRPKNGVVCYRVLFVRVLRGMGLRFVRGYRVNVLLDPLREFHWGVFSGGFLGGYLPGGATVVCRCKCFRFGILRVGKLACGRVDLEEAALFPPFRVGIQPRRCRQGGKNIPQHLRFEEGFLATRAFRRSVAGRRVQVLFACCLRYFLAIVGTPRCGAFQWAFLGVVLRSLIVVHGCRWESVRVFFLQRAVRDCFQLVRLGDIQGVWKYVPPQGHAQASCKGSGRDLLFRDRCFPIACVRRLIGGRATRTVLLTVRESRGEGPQQMPSTAFRGSLITYVLGPSYPMVSLRQGLRQRVHFQREALSNARCGPISGQECLSQVGPDTYVIGVQGRVRLRLWPNRVELWGERFLPRGYTSFVFYGCRTAEVTG